MPESTLNVTRTAPDYVALVRFLVEPFLESPADLKLDCEVNPQRSRVWIRMAFESNDKGRVYGRGGRTIQSIRTVLEAAAKTAGHTVHLEIFGEREHREHRDAKPEGARREGPPRRRPVH